MSLYRQDGITLIDSDDDGGSGLASNIVWTADDTGLLFVEVKHYSLSGTGTYRISVLASDDHCNEPGPCATELPVDGTPLPGNIETGGDTDWFQFTAVSGLTYEMETFDLSPDSDTVMALYRSDGTSLIETDDDGGEGLASNIVWLSDTQETLYIKVREYDGTGTGSYSIRLTGFDDHCNTPSSCATDLIPNDTPVQGSFEIDDDQDWFEFHAAEGMDYVIETGDLSSSPWCDTVISLFGSNGERLESDDDGGLGLASRISWNAIAAGTYFVKVAHYSSDGRGSYSVSVRVSWGTLLETDGTPIPGSLENENWYLYLFMASEGRSYTIETGNLSALCNTIIQLWEPDGLTVIASDDDGGEGLASKIGFVAEVSGPHYVGVRAFDASSMGDYEISALEQDDYPNTWTEAAELLTNGTRVHGEFESGGDEDWFRFNAAANVRYVIQTGNLTDGCDTVLALYAAEGDDSTLVAFDDDSGEGLASEMEWIAPQSGTFYILLRHYASDGTGAYDVWVRASSSDDHADNISDGTALNVGDEPVSGGIDRPGDVDWFQFEAQVGVEYVIETTCLDEACDTLIGLYGTDGSTRIAADDDGGEGLGSRIVRTAETSGTYYIEVLHFCPEDTGAYQISIRQQEITCTPIQTVQTVNGNLSQEGEGALYCLPVSGGNRIGVLLQGPPSGADFDLYVRWNAPPSLSEYDARGFSATSNEECEVTVASSGTLYILVQSYSGIGDFSLLAEENPYQPGCDFTLTEGVPHASSLSGAGDGKLYCLDVEEGDQVLIALDTQTHGSDFDLYLKYGAPPSLSDYDTRAYTVFPHEAAALQNLPTGTLYVWVVSYSGSGDYVVEAQVSPTQSGCMKLTDGVSQTDHLYFTYDEQLYCFDVEAGDQITVTLDGPESGADFDLFLKFGTPPALDDWDGAGISETSNEEIQFTATSDGIHYIVVWSYSGSGEYSIRAGTSGRQGLGLVTKLAQTPSGQVQYMKGSIVDRASGGPLQPATFCITVKNVGKFCYRPGGGQTSQVTFVPGGYFLLVFPQAVAISQSQPLLTCTLSDVPCYRALEKDFTMEAMSNAVFDISLDSDSDCDGDGMACGWEKRYGLNIWKNDASLDLDEDTYTNLEEYNAGTNPNDKNSVPLTLKSVLKGDINGDRSITPADAIMALQAASGMSPQGIRLGSDVNGDGKVGMEEAVYVLQSVAELRIP
jgi:hypothetical protein